MMDSVEPEHGNSNRKKKRRSFRKTKSYASHVAGTGADPTIRKRVSETKKRGSEYRKRVLRFWRFATSPVGALIVAGGGFLLIVGFVWLVQLWVHYESRDPSLRGPRVTSITDSLDTTGIDQPKRPEWSLQDLDSSEKAFSQSQQLYFKGKLEEAVQLMESFFDEENSNSDEKMFTAILAFETGKVDKANEMFKKAHEQNHLDDRILFNWGEFLRHIKRPDEAYEKLIKTVELKPGNPLYFMKAQFARIETGSIFILFFEAEKQIFVEPSPPEWLMVMAAICFEMGEISEATRMLSEAKKRMSPADWRSAVLTDRLIRTYLTLPEVYSEIIEEPPLSEIPTWNYHFEMS